MPRPTSTSATPFRATSAIASPPPTDLRYSRRDYERRQDPYDGLNLPAFEVCLDPVSVGNNLNCNAVSGNPNGRVNLGPVQFRQSNYLKVRNQFVTAVGEIRYEGHVVKMLGEFGRANVFNLLVPSTSGLYYFDFIADLEAGRASQLVYANALTSNPNDAAAAFSYKSLRFGMSSPHQVVRVDS